MVYLYSRLAYFQLRFDQFQKIFLPPSSVLTILTYKKCNTLKYWAFILIGVFIASSLVFTSIVIYQIFSCQSGSRSYLHCYYETTQFTYAKMFPYSSFFVVLERTFWHWSKFAAFYLPQVLIFFSIAMASQFKYLIEAATCVNMYDAYGVDLSQKGTPINE